MENPLGLPFSEGLDARFNLRISAGKNLSREQPRILCTSDRHCCHGNSAWHLDDRKQRVEPSEIFRRDRDADDGKVCFCGEHSREMSRTACSGDNHFDTSCRGLLGIDEQSVRSPMRRDNHQFIGNSEFGEYCNCLLKDWEVRLASPKNSDQRAGSFLSLLLRSTATDDTGHKTKSPGSFDIYAYRRGFTIAVFLFTVKITLALSNSPFMLKN